MSSSSSSSAAMSAPLLAPAGSSSWTCGRCSWGCGRNLVLAAFAVVFVVHMVMNGIDAHLAASITKCILAPLLVLWSYLAAPKGSCPRPLLLALVFCFFGDLFLELPGCFLVGMGAFACGHVCFVYLFVNRGAGMELALRPYIAFWYFGLAVALLVNAWDGIHGALHFAVPVYVCLLISMALSSMACGYSTGFGGLCFLASDSIILLTQASAINEDTVPWGLQLLRTILYVVAIVVIAAASIRKEQASARAAALAAVPAADRSAEDIADAEIAVTASWPRTRLAAERTLFESQTAQEQQHSLDELEREIKRLRVPHADIVTAVLGHADNRAGPRSNIMRLPAFLRRKILVRLSERTPGLPSDVLCGLPWLVLLYVLLVAVCVSAFVDYGIENQLNRWGVKGVHGVGVVFFFYEIRNAHLDRINSVWQDQ